MEGLAEIRDFLWGFPMLLLLLGTGVVITVRLNFLQVRKLLYALWLVVFKSRKSKTKAKGDISPFQALTTALAATVGTGNIAGVATAIATGGPGAVFWLWVSGFFGLATKFAEVVLAVKYRVTARDGTVSGGPMYYMSNALKMKVLAAVFSFGTVIASITSGVWFRRIQLSLPYPALLKFILQLLVWCSWFLPELLFLAGLKE